MCLHNSHYNQPLGNFYLLSTDVVFRQKFPQVSEKATKIYLCFPITYLLDLIFFTYFLVSQNNILYKYECRRRNENPVVFY